MLSAVAVVELGAVMGWSPAPLRVHPALAPTEWKEAVERVVEMDAEALHGCGEAPASAGGDRRGPPQPGDTARRRRRWVPSPQRSGLSCSACRRCLCSRFRFGRPKPAATCE